MPTINQAFTKLGSNLEITAIQSSTVSTRQANVRNAIESSFSIEESFLSGSYSRACMISPLSKSDIDIFFVLGEDHHLYFTENKPAKLLNDIRAVLLKTYPKTPSISRNGQAVTISFTDFKVDVVPCFYRSGGGYLIPNTYWGPNWIATDPKSHNSIYTQANRNHSGNFKPFVKMLKGWNRSNGNFFESFHLEELARKVFLYNGIQNYPVALRYFWNHGEELLDKKIQDPAGSQYNEDIAAYLDTRKKWEEGQSRFRTAYTRANKAIEYASKNRIVEAYGEWKKIFGDYFPSYHSTF